MTKNKSQIQNQTEIIVKLLDNWVNSTYGKPFGKRIAKFARWSADPQKDIQKYFNAVCDFVGERNANERMVNQKFLLDMDIHDPVIYNSKLVTDGEYVYPEYVTVIHAMIFDWVCENYGEDAARNPSWDIPALATHIRTTFCKYYDQTHCVSYKKEHPCVKSIPEVKHTMARNASQIEIIDPIINNNLGHYELDEDEYAPKNITKIEALIYNWVETNFGSSEAMSPSWKITELAEYLHNNLLNDKLSLRPVVYLNEGQYDEEDSDEE